MLISCTVQKEEIEEILQMAKRTVADLSYQLKLSYFSAITCDPTARTIEATRGIMDVLDAINARKSIRAFTDQPVP